MNRRQFPGYPAPDGGACFPMSDGGWAYTSNSEVPAAGGAAMIRFNASSDIVEARARPTLRGLESHSAFPWDRTVTRFCE